MKVTLTKQSKVLKEVTFNWNDTLTSYKTQSTNVSDNDIKIIILQNGHEGDPVSGWKTIVE